MYCDRFLHSITSSAGSDYRVISGRVNFRAGQTEATYTVTIYDDRVPEDDEEFFIDLTWTSSQIFKRPPERTKIIIAESDSEYCSNVLFVQQ